MEPFPFSTMVSYTAGLGFLLMVPKDQIIPMNMSVGDGMKVIISGGAGFPHI